MQSGFDEDVEDLEISLEAGPMERIGFHFPVGSNNHMTVFGFFVEIGSESPFADEQLDHFGEA